MKSCHVIAKPTRNRNGSFSHHQLVLVFTIVLASFFGLSVGVSDANEEHVPTLKDIFGSIPKNSVPLMHRHSLNSPLPRSEDWEAGSPTLRPFQTLRRRLSKSTSSPPKAIEGQVSDLGFSPFSSGNSEYYVKFQLGTPVQDVLLLLDTGSSITWVQNKLDCQACSSELLPRYDHNISLTFDPQYLNGSNHPNELLEVYGDQTEVTYLAVSDTLTIDSGYDNRVVIPNFQFGIAVNVSGDQLWPASGILGMNLQPDLISPLLTQLGVLENGTYSRFSKKFRHCFPDRVKQANATSFLSFGDITESDSNSLFSSGKHLYEKKTLWTPIVPTAGNLSSPQIEEYALNLTAISVAGNRIEIDPAELTLESAVNETYTMIDSGTQHNYLREPYFSQFTEAYYNASIHLGANLGDDFFNQSVYYNISKDVFDVTMFPSVSFIFQKWQSEGVQEDEEIEIFQPKDNLILPNSLNEDNTDVFYILNVNVIEQQNVIGNYAQQNFLIEFDLEKNRAGFLRASCAFEY